MKKLLTLAVAAAMTLSVAAASATTLKLSEVHAEGYPTTLADQEFARLIEEKTEGRIKVEVYSGGQLYGEETGSIEAGKAADLIVCAKDPLADLSALRTLSMVIKGGYRVEHPAPKKLPEVERELDKFL
mgnify:CR=1 FL=1